MRGTLGLLPLVVVGAACALDDAGTAEPTGGSDDAAAVTVTSTAAGTGGGDAATSSVSGAPTSTASASDAATSGGSGAADATGGAAGTGGDGTGGSDGSGGAPPPPQRCGDEEITGTEECEGGWPCVECQVECPPGWFEGNATHTCYGRTFDIGEDDGDGEHNEVGALCADLVAVEAFPDEVVITLATPNRAGDVLAAMDACGDELDEGCWLGAVRDGDNFAWESAEPFDYPYGDPPWGVGEPNDGGGYEDCLEAVGAQATTRPLNDAWCGSNKYAVCEIVPAPPP